jgi:hypothetical protein
MGENKISTSPTYRSDNSDFVITMQDIVEDDEAFKITGELNVGAAEQGLESVFGEGDSYTRGMKVVTSDGTGTGNLTDVSAAAQSASASTFSFQGVTAGHCIYIGSELESATDLLKHWGIKSKQTTAAVEVTPKSFVFEVWNGASWTAIGVLATHSSLFYRYANELFIRANLSEHIRYGINGSATWAKTTIDGSNLFWSRIRIATTITTAPVFQQFKLHTSRAELNTDGTQTFHGSARYLGSVNSSANSGESGGVVGSSVPVGSGGLPTGWNHIGRNQLLNSNGTAAYYQFSLPEGIDTSFGITLKLYAVVQSAGAVGNSTLICSAIPIEMAGNLEADPTGGTVPVARTLANTELTTAKAGVADTDTSLDSNVANKGQLVTFGPYDVSDYYADDMLLIRLELDVSNGATIVALQLEVEGVKWTPGERI